MTRRLWLKLTSLVGLLGGCGSDSNFNQIWGGRDSVEGKLQLGKMHYDRGEFAQAERLAQDLLAINSENEEAAILLGFTFLSSGGIDPYRLACKMITLNTGQSCPKHPAATTTKQTTTQTSTRPNSTQRIESAGLLEATDAAIDLLAQGNPQYAQTNTNSGNTGNKSNTATDVLKKLSAELLSMSEADYTSLSVGKYSEGLFATTPIYQPQRISEPIRQAVNTLQKMNLALRSVCRFVDPNVLKEFQNSAGTGRYDTGCTQTKQVRRNAAKSHFLWAFAHLTEAMVYQSVLLYSSSTTAEGGGSNFQAAINALSAKTYTDAAALASLTSDLTEVKTMIDTVFDTTDGSMLSETIKDLNSAGHAIDALSLPSDISKTIRDALTGLQNIADKITQTADTSTKNSQALKTQITENFSKTIGSKVGAVFDKQISESLVNNESLTDEQKQSFKDKFKVSGIDSLTDEEKTAVFGSKAGDVEASLKESCTAYDTISAGLPPEKSQAAKPAVCQ